MTVPSSFPEKNLYIVGTGISHALAPAIHKFIAKSISLPWEFGLAEEPEISTFVARAREPDFAGAVVTLPHKRTVIPLLDCTDEHVRTLGACNNIFVRPDGSLGGTNTDWLGIHGSFVAASTAGRGKPSLIVGAGGAARAAVYALARHLDSPVVYVINRDAQEVRDLLADVQAGYTAAGVPVPEIVHVTSAEQARALETPFYICGTVPDFEPKSEEELAAREALIAFLEKPEKGVLLDMCYKPRVSRHIKLAREHGWKDVDGVNIIAYQIETQWGLWAGKDKAAQIPVQEARAALYKAADESLHI